MAVPIVTVPSVIVTTSPDFQCCTEEPSILATEPVIFTVAPVADVKVALLTPLMLVVNVSFTVPLAAILFGAVVVVVVVLLLPLFEAATAAPAIPAPASNPHSGLIPAATNGNAAA